MEATTETGEGFSSVVLIVKIASKDIDVIPPVIMMLYVVLKPSKNWSDCGHIYDMSMMI